MADAIVTDDNSNLVDMDDLDNFEKAFYGTEVDDFRPDEEPDAKEEVDENGEDAPAADEEDNASDEGETSEEDEAPEPEDKPQKKNRNSFQERIDELVADKRQAQRELESLRREFEQLRVGNTKQEPNLDLPPEAPKPDATDDKGNALYPLGEFDPKFIQAFTKFTAEQEWKALNNKAEESRRLAELKNSEDQLKNNYNERVQEFVESGVDDFHDSIGNLVETFSNVEPSYGNYLAQTVMACDNGPAIMYYLSQNIGEARKIVASGASAATLAIGRLQAKLEKPTQETPSNTKKPTEAPKPPESRSRGSRGQFAVSADTDDLDAFEREFFRR